MQSLTVIVGPTGSGKSALALSFAAATGGEIVNFDSVQLYKGFDIGSAKIPVAERLDIPHHLFDVLDVQNGYSSGEYARAAKSVVDEIARRSRVPVLVGGTGFYLSALLDGLPSLPTRDEALRARLERRENLHRLLARLDPQAAKRIHGNDRQKLIRALEIRILTGKPAPAPGQNGLLSDFRITKIGLDPPREALVERLKHRTQNMFSQGLLEEVRSLLAVGCTGNEKPFESLGYNQAIRHLRGEVSLDEAIESTFIETRQYAKRQRTWFRRDADIHWLAMFGDDREALPLALHRHEQVQRAGH